MRRLAPFAPTLVVSAVLAIAASGCAGTETDRDAAASTAVGGGSDATVTAPATAVGAPDPFCTGWFDYATTVRILVSLTLDTSAAGAQRLAEIELLSARSMEEAVNTIGAHWPPELVGERSAVLADVVGPSLRRAQKALAEMAASGLSGGDTADLRLVWRDVLLEASREPSAGTASWLDRADVPAGLRSTLQAAATAFAAAVTAFGADPTLRHRISLLDPLDTPRTDAYLADHCPDAASVASGLEF